MDQKLVAAEMELAEACWGLRWILVNFPNQRPFRCLSPSAPAAWSQNAASKLSLGPHQSSRQIGNAATDLQQALVGLHSTRGAQWMMQLHVAGHLGTAHGSMAALPLHSEPTAPECCHDNQR